MLRHDIIQFWKSQAAEAGVPWAHVAAAYRSLRREQWAQIEGLIQLRMCIWSKFETNAKLRYRRAFTDGDQTLVPGWDLIASSVAAERHLEHDNIAEYLWDIARQDKPQMPDISETYAAALEECLEMELSFDPAHFADGDF